VLAKVLSPPLGCNLSPPVQIPSSGQKSLRPTAANNKQHRTAPHRTARTHARTHAQHGVGACAVPCLLGPLGSRLKGGGESGGRASDTGKPRHVIVSHVWLITYLVLSCELSRMLGPCAVVLLAERCSTLEATVQS